MSRARNLGIMAGPNDRWVNAVIDFQADNTGAATAHTAINNAINSISSGIVFIPAGDYLLNSSIEPKAGVKILCEGKGTVFRAGTNSMSMISRTGGAGSPPVNEFFYEIEGGWFVPNGKTGVTAVEFVGGEVGISRLSNITLKDMYISAMGTGINLQNCVNVSVTDVFMTACAVGYKQEDCADVDLTNVRAQNGSAQGFYIIGTKGSPPSAYDEGFRGTNISTNGQAVGFRADDQDWIQLSNSSFTTCSTAPGDFNGCHNVSLSGCDWAAANSVIGLSIDSSCSKFTITGGHVVLNSFGINLLGDNHTVMGVSFHNNSNVDLYLNGCTYCAVTGNRLESTGVSWSILEAGAADFNVITGNIAAGTETLVGDSSRIAGEWVTATTSMGAATTKSVIDIPSWVTEIDLHFEAITNNSANTAPIVLLGDSGGYETTGYSSRVDATAGATAAGVTESATDGFLLHQNAACDAADTLSGTLRLRKFVGNEWMADGQLVEGSSAAMYIIQVIGRKTLSGTLDKFRITTQAGTATFDGGTLHYRWR